MNVNKVTCIEIQKVKKQYLYTFSVESTGKETHQVTKRYREIYEICHQVGEKRLKNIDAFKSVNKTGIFKKNANKEQRVEEANKLCQNLIETGDKQLMNVFFQETPNDTEETKSVKLSKKNSKKKKKENNKEDKEVVNDKKTGGDNAVQSDKSTSQNNDSNNKCKVVHDHTAKEKGELTVKSGQIVEVYEESNAGWCFVSLKDHFGVIPVNCMDKKTFKKLDIESTQLIDPTPGKYVSKRGYEAKSKDEVSYPEGATIEMIWPSTSIPGWWLIRYNGSTGITPMVNLRPATKGSKDVLRTVSIYDRIAPRGVEELEDSTPYSVVTIINDETECMNDNNDDDDDDEIDPYDVTNASLQFQNITKINEDIDTSTTDNQEYSEIIKISEKPSTATKPIPAESSFYSDPPKIPSKSEEFQEKYGTVNLIQSDEGDLQQKTLCDKTDSETASSNRDCNDINSDDDLEEDMPDEQSLYVNVDIRQSEIGSVTPPPKMTERVSTDTVPIQKNYEFYNSVIEAVNKSDEISDSFKEKNWFAGSINRKHAEEIIKKKGTIGQFCVRRKQSKTATEVEFALTVQGKKKIHHFAIIKKSNDSPYCLGKHSFSSMPKLVLHLSHNAELKIGLPQKSKLSNALNIKQLIEEDMPEEMRQKISEKFN